MKLEQIQLPVTNLLHADYIAGKDKTHPFFEYHNEENDYKKRIDYLKSREYQFEQLASVIEQYMSPFGLSDKVKENIAQLRNGAYAIVGGQQAGILTGPLYSVHKAITVLLLTKEKSEALQIPLVPIFWIAGEDHDIEEINHTYTVHQNQVKKCAYSIKSRKKTMASETVYDKDEMTRVIKSVFADYGETQYTKDLLKQLTDAVNSNETFTQFFTACMNELFKEHGLLMIDAAYKPFRKLQSNYFIQMVNNSKEIARAVFEQEQSLGQAGYPLPIQANANGVNLFFVEDGERHLLEWDGEIAKNNAAQIKLTKEQLIDIATNCPEQLSNNVVTRPLMQDLSLPVLSFVGGPGELAYWATLKPAFEQLNMQMPIFTPRMHITLVSRNIYSILEQQNLKVMDVFTGESKKRLNEFIDSIQDKEALMMIASLHQQIEQQYETLAKHLREQSIQMDKVLEKNNDFHQEQLNYLKRKVMEQVQLKHDVQIKRYDKLHHEITPLNGLQERTYSPYKYINEFGPTFINQLIEGNMKVSTKHNVVYL